MILSYAVAYLDAADKMDKGTQVFSSGSKSSATIKEPANRIQYRSNHMELHIKKKLTKVSSNRNLVLK